MSIVCVCMRGVVGKQEFGLQERGVEWGGEHRSEEWRTKSEEESENRVGGGENRGGKN